VLPILVLFAIIVGAWLLSRDSGERIKTLEEADRIAGYDPHKTVRQAEERAQARLIAEANRRNREGR
jgi:hypothetical protein